jgi:DNA-binding protein Fis
MGAILLIEDDRNVQGLIEKFFPHMDLKVIGTVPTGMEEPPREGQKNLAESVVPVAAEAVRRFLQNEVETGTDGRIHQEVIGKVEKFLIGIVLEQEKGNQVRVARRLGLHRNTLSKKIRELQITTRIVSG